MQRDYDARVVPFDKWESQINDKYIHVQNETAKKVLRRYFKNIVV